MACRTPVTLDPAPPACYVKRADSDAGSSVPRAAVGSDSLARFRGCIKGASRRAPRGHCPSLALHMGYVPLARQVEGVTTKLFYKIFSYVHVAPAHCHMSIDAFAIYSASGSVAVTASSNRSCRLMSLQTPP